MLGCSNKEQDDYEVLRIENNPGNSSIDEYPNIEDKNILIEGIDIFTLNRNAENFYKKIHTILLLSPA